MKKFTKMLKQAVIFENPTFVSFLALCPTLAITHSLETALGMGLSVIFVLFFSNILVSMVRKIVPSEIRIPIYISIIATLVTVVEMILEAFVPTLYASLGVYLALIVVNCIILGRAEAFASENNVVDSALDGLTMGIAFTTSLSLIAIVRELIATGKIGLLNLAFIDQKFMPSIFVKGPGAFFTLGIMAWIFNELMKSYQKKKKGGK
ncbi:MAG: electron transport complex subunit RsxE [Bacilli bacterium]